MRKLYRFLLIASALVAPVAALAADGALHARVMTTRHATADVVIASLIVTAPRSSETDAAPVVQAAIDRVARAGGGVVYLPVGRYRLDQPIVLREGVTLRGDWARPDRALVASTTVLMPTSGRGTAEGTPAITMERGSGLREVSIWYPDQRADAIEPYPWTIHGSTTRSGDNYTVLNVTLVNAYQGMQFGPESNELHTIRNVFGTPLKAGISVDTCTDIGRLTDVSFSPVWWERSGMPGAPAAGSVRAALRARLLQDAIGVDMLRSDWEYVYNVRVSGYATGFRCRAGKMGTANAVMYRCSADYCRVGLDVYALNGVGLAATGCTFAGSAVGVRTDPRFAAVVQLNTCRISATIGSAVSLEGRGTVTMQGCTLGGWRGTAVTAERGLVALVGCTFEKSGRHIEIGKDVSQARVLGCRFVGKPAIVSQSTGDVMVADGGLRFARPDLSLQPEHPRVGPATRRLFDVTRYGAGSVVADNTGAFARALAAAGQAGGGTVYVPAGRYRLAGTLVIPRGVELRGVFDVPHHTQSAGSVLLPTAGRGKATGTSFLRLASGSGLRGLTVWYPEQNAADIVAYPWTVQSLGPRCWVIDVTIGNAFQGVDFWTHPSDGHVISYLAGGYFRRGVFVSKSAGAGWVEDVQMNPHYIFRLPEDGLPHPDYGDRFQAAIDYQQANLDGIVFGRCAREYVRGTFLYSAHNGLRFANDNGGASARVLQHGTDAGSQGVFVEAVGSRGVDLIDTQLVTLGKQAGPGIVTARGLQGNVRMFATQVWACPSTADIAGGDVLLQQFNTLSGALRLRGGTTEIDTGYTQSGAPVNIAVEAGCKRARIVAGLASGLFVVRNAIGSRLWGVGCSASVPPVEGRSELKTGWEPDDNRGPVDTVMAEMGGIRSVTDLECRPVEGEAHSGNYALRISGVAQNRDQSFVYYRALEGPLTIRPDSVLTYWHRPLNELGRKTGIDAVFTDGSTLRDLGLSDTDGVGVHPGTDRGTVNQWTKHTIPIGRAAAGKQIVAVMAAYDGRPGLGRFAALFDDLEIAAPGAGISWQVTAQPASGTYSGPITVALSAAPGVSIRYTLDGSTPGLQSPVYRKPIRLAAPGLHDLRCVVASADGVLSTTVVAFLYEIWPHSGSGPASPRP